MYGYVLNPKKAWKQESKKGKIKHGKRDFFCFFEDLEFMILSVEKPGTKNFLKKKFGFKEI
jgi:hypothetical protein